MSKTKKSAKSEDYYAIATIEIQIYLQAQDEEDAENVAENVLDSIKVDSDIHCDIELDGCEVTGIHLHE